MTYTLSTELLDGEEREALRLLAGRQSITIRIEDAWTFWPFIVGCLHETTKVSVIRGADYVKIELRG